MRSREGRSVPVTVCHGGEVKGKTFSSRLQSAMVGRSKEGLEAAGHSQEERMNVCMPTNQFFLFSYTV